MRAIIKPYLGVAVSAVFLLGVAPSALTAFRLDLLAKYCCFALVGVGIGLVWGRGGMLSFGQGLFFGLGAYVIGMHLKLTDAGPGAAPDFMNLYANGVVPIWWEPFRSAPLSLAAVIAVPVLVASALGAAILKRRVRGAYFAILSQALAAAFAVWLDGQVKTTGGANGLTDFKGFFGYSLSDPVNRLNLYYLVAGILIISMAAVTYLNRTRYGELLVACRDAEDRVQFLGYDPALIKLFAFAIGAGLAGIGGALFVPVAGIISPADVGAGASIAMVAGVALAGRTSVIGAAFGTIAVAWAQTALSEAFPSSWSYVQGLIFVVVVMFLPGGLADLRWPTRRELRSTPSVMRAAS